MRRILSILVTLAIVCVAALFMLNSCPPDPAPPKSSEEVTQPAVQECTEARPEWCEGWEPDLSDPYVKGTDMNETPHDLCPPDGEATLQPFFADIEPVDTNTFVRPGLFHNENGEIFNILVYGSSEEAIAEYTNNVRVCVDVVFLKEQTTESAIEPPSGDLVAEAFTLNSENLFIEIDFVAQGTVDNATLSEILNELAVSNNIIMQPLKSGDVMTRAQNIIPPDVMFDEYGTDHAIDLIIDPSINSGVSHDYRAKCRTSASAKIKVSGPSGSGRVTGYLYRNSVGVRWGTVDKDTGNTVTILTHSSGSTHETYDLGVKGGRNESRYRVSGTWTRSFSASAPSGGGTVCP